VDLHAPQDQQDYQAPKKEHVWMNQLHVVIA
jgi:hypothetical protein